MKKFLAGFLILSLLVSLSGCSFIKEAVKQARKLVESMQDESLPNESTGAGEESKESQYIEGVLGEAMHTCFFTFIVESAQLVDTYAGQSPSEGYTFLDAVITVQNDVYKDTLPMFNWDFQVQWGNGDKDYAYGLTELGDEVMPEEYTIAENQKVTYHIVYEVPEEAAQFCIAYMEIFEDDTTGNTFFVYFETE